MVVSESERSPLQQFLMDFRSHVSTTVGKCEDSGPAQESESSTDDTASPSVSSPTSSNSPNTSSNSPNTSSNSPPTSSNSPTASNSPATSSNSPATSSNSPATSSNSPATSSNSPATSSNSPPTSSNSPPTSSNSPPTSSNSPPTSSNSPATSNPTPRKPKKCCNYCRCIGKNWQICKSHATFDCNGLVLCKHLASVACPLSAASGHGTHPVRDCHLQSLVRYTVDRYSLVKAYPPVFMITVWYDDPWYAGYFSTCQYSIASW